MCLGIPMQVQEVQGTFALCSGPHGQGRIDMLLVSDAQPGDWILTFLGAGREIIDATRAHLINEALGGLGAVTNGEVDEAMLNSLLDVAFSDLVNREPELPPHLQALLQNGDTK